jgi:hypothetical protein
MKKWYWSRVLPDFSVVGNIFCKSSVHIKMRQQRSRCKTGKGLTSLQTFNL